MNEIQHDYSIKHRREGRIIAFQSIFSLGFENKSLDDLLSFDWIDEEYSEESFEYAKFLISGTLNNLEEIDTLIKNKLVNWGFDRISLVDKSILRFATFSLLYEKGVPEKVIINEAIEIVKKIGTEESYKFVNGILDAIKKFKTKSTRDS